MSRMTFPSVPPGHEITDEAARIAALKVREWYEGGDELRIETDAIVTVVRWAINRTRLAHRSTTEPALTYAQADRIVGALDESDAGHDEIAKFIYKLAGVGEGSASPPASPRSTPEHRDIIIKGDEYRVTFLPDNDVEIRWIGAVG